MYYGLSSPPRMQTILSEELDGAKQQDYFSSIGLNCERMKAVANFLDIQCHIALTLARPNHLGIFYMWQCMKYVPF